MRTEGFASLRGKLKRIEKFALDASKAVVIVGFSQLYALYVHEDLNARHAKGKTAKYLEGPARRLSNTLQGTIRRVYLARGSMIDALLVAGLRLLREAQEIVPVDTSALRASGYVAKESEARERSMAAFRESEMIRLSALASRDKERTV